MKEFGLLKTILITGSSGFIGRALCDKLGSLFRVIGLDLIERDPAPANITRFKADLVQRGTIQSVFEKYCPEIVIHCAGIAHQKATAIDTATYMRVNSEGTENLARVAGLNNPKVHFIFLSSVSVYGEKSLETAPSEESQCSPSSDYAFSKLDAEKRLVEIYEEGLCRKLTILRLAPVYDREWGFNLERRVFAPKKVAYVRFGKGMQKMSALCRANLVEFIDYMLRRDDNSRAIQKLNVGDLNPYSFNDIIWAFRKSGIWPNRKTITIPLSMVWVGTRAAAFVMRRRRKWVHSCYDKLAADLVFDNSKMMGTGFRPRHNLKTIFSRSN